MKRYKGRELNVEDARLSLTRKGCIIKEIEIDVRKAKYLGNKSFGLIDFLTHYRGYYVVGSINSKQG